MEQEQLISIKAWFGDPNESHVVTHNWFDLLFGGLGKKDLMTCNGRIYSEMYMHLYTFMDMLSRAFAFQNKPLQEYLNIFNLLVDYFYALLKKEAIELVIFEDIPHDGGNYVLYCMAKAMGIPTLIVCQTMFPDRFFYVFDVEDFGRFDQVYEIEKMGELAGLQVKKQFEKDLFYMKEDTVTQRLQKKLEIVLNFSKWKEERLAVWHNSQRKYGGFLKGILQRTTKKLLEYQLDRDYVKNSQTSFNDNVDLTMNFVYFPLHMQPEMTTSALGGIYCDQLLAIERLVDWIPDDWYIYVKENPKQTSFMRGKYFFERLKLIPKVKAVSGTFDTYELIRHSRFVATITGTAGWEAISGGKNVVVFGKAWYYTLPGVFAFSTELSLQKVLDYQICHEELEKRVALLLKKTGRGLVNRDYLPMNPQYQQEENNQQLAAFFRYILARI
ncbi:MAG: hypothetical protein ABFC57_18250 [Veillonellales bacterium]